VVRNLVKIQDSNSHVVSYIKDKLKQSELKKIKPSCSFVRCECRVGKWMHRCL